MTGDPIHKVPDEEFSGQNLGELEIIQSHGYAVFEWTPGQDGKGSLEAVVLSFFLTPAMENGPQLAFRITSRAESNRMIKMLEFYRDRIWPLRTDQ